jgi:hypothetical protein
MRFGRCAVKFRSLDMMCLCHEPISCWAVGRHDGRCIARYQRRRPSRQARNLLSRDSPYGVLGEASDCRDRGLLARLKRRCGHCHGADIAGALNAGIERDENQLLRISVRSEIIHRRSGSHRLGVVAQGGSPPYGLPMGAALPRALPRGSRRNGKTVASSCLLREHLRVGGLAGPGKSPALCFRHVVGAELPSIPFEGVVTKLSLAARNLEVPVRAQAAVAARHVWNASSRRTRSVRREARWRWTLKVLRTAAWNGQEAPG